MPMIQVTDLTKTYRVSKREPGPTGAVKGLVRRRKSLVHALREVSFDVEPGEILGYIGPNGAGKSTTIKILSGIMRPDGGSCTVDGRVPWKNRIEHVRRLGVVFGQRTQLWWDLPVRDSFDLLRTMYRVDAAAHRDRLAELDAALELAGLLDTPVRQLSLGQRMRCEIAASLLHDPRVLFLDEPTIGLDAVAKIALRRFIRAWNERKRITVILTTHDMDDIEELSHRILVLHQGAVIYRGDIAGLRDLSGARRELVIDTEGTETLARVPGAEMSEEGARVTFRYNPRLTDVNAILAAVSTRRRIVDLVAQAEPIEQVVARIYEGRTGP